MAKPRMFISSTFYDLRHVRSSLEVFVDSLGFEPILSEKGDIAYTPDAPLDESCYREVQNSDIYVLIVGGRYGSEASEQRTTLTKEFYDRYESITKKEYQSAVNKDVPIYVLIEKSVYAEYQTFRRNRDNTAINYAHVDSANIFYFIEEILAQPRNNPVHTFDGHSDIQIWLKEQWAGLFRELIQRMSSQQQLASLTTQVNQLAEVNATLKRYLEELLKSEAPEKSEEIISSEENRLKEYRKLSLMAANPFLGMLISLGIDPELIADTLKHSDSLDDFLKNFAALPDVPEHLRGDLKQIKVDPNILGVVNSARTVLGLEPFGLTSNIKNTSDRRRQK
jgi:Domain of unknown function (DUF4062)